MTQLICSKRRSAASESFIKIYRTQQQRYATALLVLFVAIVFLAPVARTQTVPKTGTQVVLLGTGNPSPNPDHSGPATAVVVNGSAYLVDMGAGVVRRASAAAQSKGIAALGVKNLKIVFVTHLHSDHTIGYPDLITTPAIMGRKAPIEVYGPKGLKAMTDNVLKAYSEDIDIRLHGLEQGDAEAYKVNVHEIKPGIIYKDANVTVKAFLVPHGSWPQAFGYRFETADRTIVFSGDTAPSQTVIDNCNGCDILLHEVYSVAGVGKGTDPSKKYFASFHTSTYELAELAAKAKPKLLILYHQMPLDSTYEALLKELQERYKGRVVSGNDLDVY
jgi:ribonuclease BN (tRNA processing enzyme)